MTERPEQIQSRLSGLEQIGQVTSALNAIASGQSAAARGALPAISAHAATVADALAVAAALAGAGPGGGEGPGLLLIVGAAQGFSGAYPTHLAEAARAALTPGTAVLAVGGRTLAALADKGVAVLWSAEQAPLPEAVPDLASRITDAILDLVGTHPGPIRALTGAAEPGGAPEIATIFPPEVAPARGALPDLTLPPAELLQGLLSEALFAAVARTLMQGLAAEAQARMQAMANARNNLRERRAKMQAAWQQARQEQMTTEMIELASARPDAAAQD